MISRRKTSTISLRIEDRLKGELQTVAEKQQRTTSSLLGQLIQTFLDSLEGHSPPRSIQEERRLHHRTKIVLPARWRISQGENTVEHDVIVKNIGVGGAYTEYVNGQWFHLVKDLHDFPLALAVRTPGSMEPMELDSDVTRLLIAKDFVGVGLRFKCFLTQEGLLLEK